MAALLWLGLGIYLVVAAGEIWQVDFRVSAESPAAATFAVLIVALGHGLSWPVRVARRKHDA